MAQSQGPHQASRLLSHGESETWDGVLSLLERPSLNDSSGGTDLEYAKSSSAL